MLERVMAETRPPAPASEISKADKAPPSPVVNFGVLVNQAKGNPLDVRFSERPDTVFEIGRAIDSKPWPASQVPKVEAKEKASSSRFGDGAPKIEDHITGISSDELDKISEEVRGRARENRPLEEGELGRRINEAGTVPNRASGSGRSGGIDESDPSFRFGMPPMEVDKTEKPDSKSVKERAATLAIGGTVWAMKELRARVKRYIPGLPNWKVLLVPLVAGGVGLLPDTKALPLDEAVRASEPAPQTRQVGNRRGPVGVAMPGSRTGTDWEPGSIPAGSDIPANSQFDWPKDGGIDRMPGNVYGPVDRNVAQAGPDLPPKSEISRSPAETLFTSPIDYSVRPDAQEKINSEGYNLRGLILDQLAQKLNNNYEVHSEAVRKSGSYTDEGDPFLLNVVKELRDNFIRRYGEKKGTEYYERFITDQVKYAKDNMDKANPGVHVLDPRGEIVQTQFKLPMRTKTQLGGSLNNITAEVPNPESYNTDPQAQRIFNSMVGVLNLTYAPPSDGSAK